jgi:hypothetical protein
VCALIDPDVGTRPVGELVGQWCTGLVLDESELPPALISRRSYRGGHVLVGVRVRWWWIGQVLVELAWRNW